ncbi:MAG TPA: DGQHR domain-containing protein DpdB [Solirubrobacteraceae bacterium]|nr:DGQHR domain-containing protein DpdB [Solirubrobacteraceae bacterium]
MSKDVMRVPALAIRQGPKRHLYSFAVDGKRLGEITTISRIHREERGALAGYQRPEVLAHVKAIRRYLESPGALMPNALVVAFDTRVKFQAAERVDGDASCRIGHLLIPLVDEEGDQPGWLVDGQQRSAALRDAELKSFPVPVVSFITADVREQRSQFILVNNTKPLPSGLINELLPATEGELPVTLLRRRYPAVLLEELNFHPESPLRGLIRTPTVITGVIKDTSMLKMLEASITDGALYRFRDPVTGGGAKDSMLELLFDFWDGVASVWPDEFGLAPRKTRLSHGAGIAALGYLLDAIVDRHAEQGTLPDAEAFAADLRLIAPYCRWTSGAWDFGMKWDEIQVVPAHITALTDYLLAVYRRETSPPAHRRARREPAERAA